MCSLAHTKMEFTHKKQTSPHTLSPYLSQMPIPGNYIPPSLCIIRALYIKGHGYAATFLERKVHTCIYYKHIFSMQSIVVLACKYGAIHAKLGTLEYI